MKNLNKFILILFLFLLLIILSAYSYSNAVYSDISNNVFRLHVIANSDSTADQELKLIVRDSILEYVSNISNSTSNKNELIELLNQNKLEIQTIAEDIIKEHGFDYSVNVSIGNFEFPIKSYGDISLPTGYYDALKLEIGNAKGKNWWCVMFPPLCFVDVSSGIMPEESKNILEENLLAEEYNLISSSSSDDVKIKFKIVELFQNVKMSTAKK